MTSYNQVKLSPIIVGTMRLGKWGVQYPMAELQAFIEGCMEKGATTFDHADIYGDYTTEADFGAVLKHKASLRTKMQLITKCGIRRVCENRPAHHIKSYDSSSEHIVASVDNSLHALQTDYIDVLLIHRPDFLMQPEEIARTIEDLYQAGKVLAFGVSNFAPSQVALLQEKIPLISNQIELSLLALEAFQDGTLDQCLKMGIAPMAWSPFGGGSLFQASEDARIQRIHKVAAPLLEKYNCSLDQLLLAWLLRHPSRILPVLGTSKLERVQAALEAQKITLASNDWYELWQASTGSILP